MTNFIIISLFLLSPIPYVPIEIFVNVLFIFKAFLFIILTSICFFIFISNKNNILFKKLKNLSNE